MSELSKFKRQIERMMFEAYRFPMSFVSDPRRKTETSNDFGIPDVEESIPYRKSRVGDRLVSKKSTAKTKIEDHDPRTAVIASAMEAVTTPSTRRWLYGAKPVVAVIQVPSVSWVKPVEEFLQAVADVSFNTFARTGSNRLRDKPDVNNDEVSEKISRGRRVVGIAVDPVAMLPATLLAAADLTIKLDQPTGAIVCDAINRCLYGPIPKKVDDSVAARLSFDDIVACMRFGSSPSKAVERMRSASARRSAHVSSSKVPLLETAVEYGAARDWALSFARDIKDYRAGTLPWSQCQKGVVFHSEPGCGKSLLIDSIGQHAGIAVVRASVAGFFANNNGDLGAVINAQREVFSRAAALAPCILFLDEIDAVPNRATLSSRGADWWLPVINDLLMLLDSAIAGQREGIVVIGCTNRIKGVDAALLRPGRLEQSIEIGRPNLQGVLNIMRFHLGESLKGVDITHVARLAEGATPAEIMAMVRAARQTARHAERDLRLKDLQEQVAGTEIVPPEMLRRFAVHEAAHAVTAVALDVGAVDHVVLRTRGRAGGQTKVLPKVNDLPTLVGIEDRVVSILAADAAEELILGESSTGSGNSDASDMAIATGMISVVYTSTNLTGSLFFHCNDTEAVETVRADPRLRRAVQRHLAKLEERARDLVRERRSAITDVADELTRRRYLSGDDITAIIAASDARARPSAARPSKKH